MADITSLSRDYSYEGDISAYCSPAEIRNVEILSGIQFPESYRIFLEKYNGGSFMECLFPDSEFGPLIVVDFFSVVGKKINLHQVIENMKVFLPRGSLPFAEDPGGNIFFINTEENGKVFFWEHETREIVPLAENFSIFVRSLVFDS